MHVLVILECDEITVVGPGKIDDLIALLPPKAVQVDAEYPCYANENMTIEYRVLPLGKLTASIPS